jgi:phage baseplate assembly protein W
MARDFKEKPLYKEVVIENNNKTRKFDPGTLVYKGTSTVNPDNTSPVLHDLALIKQDLLNHFHIRQGEKLSDPNFGCILWDLLFEPLTDPIKRLIIENVNTIIKSEPRVYANQITVDEYEHGIAIYCELTYLPWNISETMRLDFDKNAGYALA